MKYIALTIGPIYKTLLQAKRTRMLWAGSYLFSYVIQKFTDSLNQNGIKVILPSTAYIQEHGKSNGAGIYPDRLILQPKDEDSFSEVQKIISELLETIAKDMHTHIVRTNLPNAKHKPKTEIAEKEVISFIKKYFQIYIAEMEIPDQGNILKPLYKQLEVLELTNQYIAKTEENHLQHFLYRVNKRKSFLIEHAFPDERKNKKFDSLIQITTRGLGRIENRKEEYDKLIKKYIIDPQDQENEDRNEDLQEELLQKLKETFKDDFRNYHKYVAVMYADGDYIGEILSQVGTDPTLLGKFSKNLIEFNMAISKTISDYGAAPIYLGGEDILLFAPIACLSKDGTALKNVFDLVSEVDNQYHELFAKKYETKPPATLAWGIAIAYHKQPLNFTLEHAKDLLKLAKKQPQKNAIAFRFEKHSGQYFEATIQKGKVVSFELLLKFIKQFIVDKQDKNNDNLIASIAHRFNDKIFEEILKAATKDESLLKYLFENNFNENIHKQKATFMYDELPKLISQIYLDYGESEAKDLIYTVLRYIHFINSKDKDEQ